MLVILSLLHSTGIKNKTFNDTNKNKTYNDTNKNKTYNDTNKNKTLDVTGKNKTHKLFLHLKLKLNQGNTRFESKDAGQLMSE
jgi:hypothetical protein